MSDGTRFSHGELVKILQESIAAAGGEGDRTYTAADLTAAARELGLDPGRVQEVAQAQLARRQRQSVAHRPFDTRIQIETDGNTLRLRIPPLRPRAAHVTGMGFSLFCLTFMSFWTWGAAHAGGFFAAFSIPFWLVGLGMLGGSVLPLMRTTTLEIGPDTGELVTRPLGRRRLLRREEMRVRWGNRIRQVVARGQDPAVPAVLLEHGTQTIALLEGFSEQEQRWLTEELRAFLGQPSTPDDEPR